MSAEGGKLLESNNGAGSEQFRGNPLILLLNLKKKQTGTVLTTVEKEQLKVLYLFFPSFK